MNPLLKENIMKQSPLIDNIEEVPAIDKKHNGEHDYLLTLRFKEFVEMSLFIQTLNHGDNKKFLDWLNRSPELCKLFENKESILKKYFDIKS